MDIKRGAHRFTLSVYPTQLLHYINCGVCVLVSRGDVILAPRPRSNEKLFSLFLCIDRDIKQRRIARETPHRVQTKDGDTHHGSERDIVYYREINEKNTPLPSSIWQ